MLAASSSQLKCVNRAVFSRLTCAGIAGVQGCFNPERAAATGHNCQVPIACVLVALSLQHMLCDAHIVSSSQCAACLKPYLDVWKLCCHASWLMCSCSKAGSGASCCLSQLCAHPQAVLPRGTTIPQLVFFWFMQQGLPASARPFSI